MKHIPINKQAGFTLMELIVSIAIMSMMMFLINRIFFDTTEAVSRGIATSKIIANTRTIGEQLKEDFDAFMGPRAYTASPSYPIADSQAAGFLMIVNKKKIAPYLDARNKDGIVQAGRSVRTDQLCFIRKTTNLTPQTSLTATRFTGSATNASYCRIWYGHLIQMSETGNIPTDLGLSGTADEYATNWMLGRQVLFLDDSVTTSDYYANYDQTLWNINITSNPFYMAESDILNISLVQSSSPGSGGSATVGIMDVLEAARDSSSRSDYINALRVNKNYIFETQRLAVRTTPNINTLNRNNIAQMHPYFMNNVSDFIVQFAGDYDSSISTGSIDLYTNGNIIWYDQDNPPPTASTDPFGNTSPTNEPYYFTPGTTAADATFIFRHDDITNWPKLLRIRYRLHDPKGELLGFDVDTNGVVLDQGEPGKWFEVIVKIPS